METRPLTPSQIRNLERILGHALSAAELQHYNSEHSDEYGYFLMDQNPQGDRKLLLIWSGCWGRGILHYINSHRKEMLSIYSPLVMIDYSLVISCIKDKRFPTPELVKAAWQKADAVIFSPIGAGYGDFSSEMLLRFVKHDCRSAQFTGPSQACWWPITPVSGEHGVHALMDQGMTDDQIWQKFLDGTFDPKFELRMAEQTAWLRGKQSFGSVKLTEFVHRNYRDQKLFFTGNHPTYPVIAFCAESCFELLGHEAKPEEYCFTLPLDAYMVGGIYPETHYEWDYYKFKYPMRYEHSWGGWKKFYHEAILDARKRFRKKTA